MNARVCLAALVLAACGGGDAGGPKRPVASAVDEREAEKDAKGLVREIYQTLSRSGNPDGLMALLAEPLVVFGPRRTDAHATRTDALVAVRASLDALGRDAKPKVRSDGLAVVAAPGGLSAWAVDVGQVEGNPMAVTAVLSNEDDFWVVVAAALAHTPPSKRVKMLVAQDAIVPTGMPGFGKVTGGAEGAVSHFKRGLADQDVWGDDLAKRSEAVVIGPSAGAVTRGKKAIAKLWKRRAKAHTRYAPAGEVSAATTADGQLAWVTAPVVQFADEDDPLPLRLFAVYERDGDAWKMIALQEALAIDEPGIGANFRKVEAPAIKDPPPPPHDEDEPKKKKKKKKRKKRRR